MRVSLLFLLPFCLASCAYEGVIVKKNSRPHPFYQSLGVEEMSSIELRDSAGVVHRQMVTPDVYARYESGQYFNDLQPLPVDPKLDVAPVLVPMRPVQPIAGRGTYPTGSQGTIASTQPTKRALASSKSGLKNATVAARPKASAPGRVATAPSTPKPRSTAPVVAKIQQPRVVAPPPVITRSAQIPSATSTARPATSTPVISTSIAHFSAEITAQGLRPVNEKAPPKKSSPPSTARKPSTAKKPAVKSVKAKSLLKPPTVETRTDRDDGSSH